jgi:HD superfamily phosphohydrolase
MALPFQTGVFQTFETISETEIIIRDQIYGTHNITEPVLIHLLRSPELLRLKGICQHGVTTFLGFGPKVTRFEHSVGAFLLVRAVGASVEEQIAALLHDISHTSLSHVVDDALSKPGEASYHEVHKSRFLKTTQLPQILIQYGFGTLKALDEELFRLVEMPSPHLCADRLDYALRDALAFEKLGLEHVRDIYQSLTAFPSASSPNRLLVLTNQDHALVLARAYQATDRDVWSNRAQADLYKRTGSIIRDLVYSGRVEEEALWKLSDQDFWALLREQASPGILAEMDRMESEGLPDEEGLRLPRDAKIRTIDPDVFQGELGGPLPLSVVLPEWGVERREYVLGRESTRE